MTYQTVDMVAFRDFDLGCGINERKNRSFDDIQSHDNLSDCYQDPITGNGYSIHVCKGEVLARAWDNEIIIEYRRSMQKGKFVGEL